MSNYMKELGLQDQEVLHRLLNHVAGADYVGLDPSTVTYNPRLIRVADWMHPIPLLSRVWRSLCHRAVFYLGHRAHRFFHPQPCRFAKGLALCLSAYAHLYCNAADREREGIRARAAHLDGLIRAKQLPHRDLWAHDCDYEIAGVPITTQTPNLVTTAFVAKGYWDWWRVTGEREYWERFLAIVQSMIETFPLVEYGDAGCFMYTPVTCYHVHNANLLMAELIARRYTQTLDAGDLALIAKSVRYSLRDLTDGFPYAGPPTENTTVDNYHTGYVLRSLQSIVRYTPSLADRLGVQEVVRKGVGFYLARFVRKGRVWFGLHGMVETHSLAESILIHKEFRHLMTEGQDEVLLSAIRRTAKELMAPEGDFFINNRKYVLFGLVRIEDRTDMVRWSQSWMIYALAYLPE